MIENESPAITSRLDNGEQAIHEVRATHQDIILYSAAISRKVACEVFFAFLQHGGQPTLPNNPMLVQSL